jgi:hypothetical protein
MLQKNAPYFLFSLLTSVPIFDYEKKARQEFVHVFTDWLENRLTPLLDFQSPNPLLGAIDP